MADESSSREALLQEIQDLRQQVERLEGVVSAFRRTEAELRKSEEALRAVSDTAEDSIFIKDADLRYIFVNPAMERILGRPASGLIGKTPFEVFSEEDASVVVSVDQAVLAGESIDAERTLRIAGEDHTFHTVQTPVFDAAGKVQAICGIVRDVTERNRAEVESQRARAFLQAVIDGIPEALMAVNLDYTVALANPKAQDLAPGRDMVGEGLKCYQVSHHRDTPCADCGHSCPMEQVKASLAPVTVEHVHYDGEGKQRYVEVTVAPIFNETGELVQIIEVVNDVTGRRRIEDALQQAHEQLEERVRERTKRLAEANVKLRKAAIERGRVQQTLHRQSLAIEQALDGIAIVDSEGIMEYSNLAWAEMHGYTQEELLGKHLRIFHTEEQMANEVVPFNEVLMKTGSNSGRIGHVTRDGKTFQTDMTSSVVKDIQGRVIGLIGRARDISKELELESELRHAQKMEAVGVLAGGIAHNLRNQLAAILGWIEIASDSRVLEPARRKCLERAANAGVRAGAHIEQLLKFSRKTRTEQKPIRPGMAVREGLELLRGLLSPTVEIQADVDDACACVMADPGEIQQVIIDLGTNAAHAMNMDGRLTVALEEVDVTREETESSLNLKEGRYVRLTVGDTGHGMSSETLERVFEPFFTTKKPGEGTGLGLSVVYGIVRDCGGEVQVQSAVGQGSSFLVFLPICTEEEVKPQDLKDEPPPPSSSGTGCVLLVDDDEDFREMLAQGLQLLGYSVESHKNALEAIASVETRPFAFDVIVTDHLMPSITGLELARRVREIRPDIPIILLSGVDEILDERAVTSVGVRARVGKPISLRDLAMVIQKTLEETTRE